MSALVCRVAGSRSRAIGPTPVRPRALKVAVVGPTHPYKGGVAAHTTSLAHELAEAGHDVTLVSWSPPLPLQALPRASRPCPAAPPTSTPFPRTVRALSWARPDTWVRTGRRLRGFDVIVVVHVIPAVVPAHLALLRAAGVAPTPERGHRTPAAHRRDRPQRAAARDATSATAS